jgi:hypothetical protein
MITGPRNRRASGGGRRGGKTDPLARVADPADPVADSLFAVSSGRSREEASDQELIDLIALAPAVEAPEVFAAAEILERRIEARKEVQ